MSEETWNQARLIPTSGIAGAEEQERRATSALLAVMTAVREFSKSLLAPLGAPSGVVETYIEVPFFVGDKKVYPDGLIRVSRGKRTWTALVEVKTGRNELDTEGGPSHDARKLAGPSAQDGPRDSSGGSVCNQSAGSRRHRTTR